MMMSFCMNSYITPNTISIQQYEVYILRSKIVNKYHQIIYAFLVHNTMQVMFTEMQFEGFMSLLNKRVKKI